VTKPSDHGAFKKRVSTGEATFGIFLGLATPMAIEIAAISGMDWVLLDLEHGPGGEDQLGSVVTTAGAYGITPLVRVESDDRIRINRALDAGIAGIMVPRVESAAQVQEVVSHFSTPPFGDRGVATYNRGALWGQDLGFLDGPSKATCIIQIETVGALDSVADIAAIDGVDILFVGPADLSFALGVPRDLKNPIFVSALDRVLSAAQSCGKQSGILAPNGSSAAEYLHMGFNFIGIASDSILLADSMKKNLTEAKKENK
jgi:2-dehydro-3-deoxyglucarate aldolase/4-hydroxy-2-oxoheptanedioate aldolase